MKKLWIIVKGILALCGIIFMILILMFFGSAVISKLLRSQCIDITLMQLFVILISVCILGLVGLCVWFIVEKCFIEPLKSKSASNMVLENLNQSMNVVSKPTTPSETDKLLETMGNLGKIKFRRPQ